MPALVVQSYLRDSLGPIANIATAIASSVYKINQTKVRLLQGLSLNKR
ncbi:MAG: hypothetical protein V7K16_10900 [Nostoc sp.]